MPDDARPPRAISGSHAPRPTTLTWSDRLGKRVRTGPWADQAVSTTAKIEQALDDGQWELAAQLVDYWMEEAKVVHVVYQVWTEGFMAYLGERLEPADLEAEVGRLRELLAFPDGAPFEPGPPGATSASWPGAWRTTCGASRWASPAPAPASRSCASAGAGSTTAAPT